MSTGFAETVRSFLAPIISYIDDDEVSEIMINSHAEIWIEKKGRILIQKIKNSRVNNRTKKT